MDKRVKKTRKNIVDVFLQLLEEKAVGDITAQEIAQLAEISRSTFYQHFTDVYNLLDQAEDEIFCDIASLLDGYPYERIREDPLHLFTELFHYFQRNSKICVVLLNKNGSITTGQRITRMIADRFQHEWELLVHGDTPMMKDYASQYVISGFVGILQTWIATGMREPVEEIAHIARTLISNSISRPVGPMAEQALYWKGDNTQMGTLKDKIKANAAGFAAGVLNDTSEYLNDQSAEIQQKVECGLRSASDKLAKKGIQLQSVPLSSASDNTHKRMKLRKKLLELDAKFLEKGAKLAEEGKEEKIAEERQKYERECKKLRRELEILEAFDSGEPVASAVSDADCR